LKRLADIQYELINELFLLMSTHYERITYIVVHLTTKHIKMKPLHLIPTLFLSLQLMAQTTYTEYPASVSIDGSELHATITLADSLQTMPIVIIIPGSGATDRNCNAGLMLHTNAYKMLATQLAHNGISSLRFDKRGVGQSSAAMQSEGQLRFETYIHDVVQWIKLVKQDKRFSEVFIAGHSEGSLIGIMAAQESKVNGFISIAGPGRRIDDELKKQLKGKLPPALYDEAAACFDTLRLGQTLSSVNPLLLSLLRPSIQPYMISWMKYDPCLEIQKLTIPILIIHGTTDIQVEEANAKLLKKTAPTAELVVIENMNHVLKEAPLDRQENMATYTDGTLPLKKELIELCAEFIKQQIE